MSSISFSQAKDAELAWVDGRLHYSDSAPDEGEEGGGRGGGGGREGGAVESKELNLVPILDAVPPLEVRGEKWRDKVICKP